MTLNDIRNQIWRLLGEPTDIDPSSDTGYNSGPWLTWVANEGQRQVAKWKNRQTGRHLRIRSLQSEMFYTTTVLEDVVSSYSSTFPPTLVLTGSEIGTGDDRYNGWVIEMTSGDADGEIKVITDFTSSTNTLTLHEAFSGTPANSDTVKLYKRFELLLPSTHSYVSEHIQLPSTSDLFLGDGNLVEVLSIVDVSEQLELGKAPRTAKFSNYYTSQGDPTMWYRYGNKIYYDNNVSEEKTFRLEYYRTPMDMVNDSDEPEIPEIFHWAIVLWGVWWGMKSNMEANKAYAAKMDWEEEMMRTKSQYDIADERINPRGKIVYDKPSSGYYV